MVRYLTLLPLLLCSQLNAETKKPIIALSEELLLFLADMENIDGKLVHPVDLQAKPEREQVAKNEDKAQKEGKDDVK